MRAEALIDMSPNSAKLARARETNLERAFMTFSPVR
jgi:hypothetical protein